MPYLVFLIYEHLENLSLRNQALAEASQVLSYLGRSKKILIHSRSVFTQRNVNSWIWDSLLINLVAFLVTLKIDLGRIGPLVFTGG